MSADRTTGDLGRKLREARERRGTSLREIANATKIAVRALEALERNEIKRLPGGIFSRAFVRAYAVEVGLPPDETVQEFIAQFPDESVTAGHPAAKPIEDYEDVESTRHAATTVVRLIALAIPIVAALIYFGSMARRSHSVADAPVPVPATPPASTPALAPAVPVTATPAPVPATAAPIMATPATSGTAPVPQAVSAAAAPAVVTSSTAAMDPSQLTIVVSTTRPCWISARADGTKVLERLVPAGERQTIAVRRELVFTVGDASAVALTLNGADARPLGKSGEVVTVRISPTNFKDYLAGP